MIAEALFRRSERRVTGQPRNRVTRLPTVAFVVISNLQFAEQTQGGKLHARNNEHAGEEHQGPVFLHDRDAPKNLSRQKPESQSASCQRSDKPGGTKEMQRP